MSALSSIVEQIGRETYGNVMPEKILVDKDTWLTAKTALETLKTPRTEENSIEGYRCIKGHLWEKDGIDFPHFIVHTVPIGIKEEIPNA